ncbi:MAG: hypothetical protein LBR39_06555, partial [Coriobacteriales bacterium]|nr:hypothetical protein [Coriobacteriales bacterium]
MGEIPKPQPEGSNIQNVEQIQEAELQAELEYSQKVERSCALLLQNPSVRPILYRILKLCSSQRVFLHDLEEQIQQQPEYAGVVHPPYTLIQWLVDVEALDCFELDEQGADISPGQLAGLTADEADDLVADWAYLITSIGQDTLEAFDPSSRLTQTMNSVPERYDTYLEVLEFLTEKRSLREIDGLLRGREVLMTGRGADDTPIKPSF